jgi:hypothetical protein
MSALTSINIPIDDIVDDLLEGDATLGEDIKDEKFSAKVGNQPIALKLRQVFEKLGWPVPQELGVYEMFEVWLVPHRVGIMRRPGSKAEITSLGIQIEYIHNGSTCSVIALIPAPQFLHHGRIGLEGLLHGKLSANGEASPGSEDSEFKVANNLGNLSIGVLASGQVGFSFRASIITPLISALGIGASNCEWGFGKHNEALFGKDMETWTFLALPKTQSSLMYRLRCYVCWRTCFFSTRRQSNWHNVACVLA